MTRKIISYSFLVFASMLFSWAVHASPVSYAADLRTTKLLPVTDILILEADTDGIVHATPYGQEIPGNGHAVITHNPPFTPARSLIIGITEGLTPEGEDKTQIIMFLNQEFADTIGGVKWSTVFPDTRHSVTITNLIAAVGGDADQLAWFTDFFFQGPGAPAVFETGGDFAVGEFSAFDQIGGAVAFGDWILNSAIELLAKDEPGTINGRPTVVLDETATSSGPFDIDVSLVPDGGLEASGAFGMRKSVVNGTGLPILKFVLDIGRGTGDSFVRSDELPETPRVSFRSFSIDETTNAFPSYTHSPERIVFEGRLDPGETAEFLFMGHSPEPEANQVTVRQSLVLGPIFEDGFEAAP